MRLGPQTSPDVEGGRAPSAASGPLRREDPGGAESRSRAARRGGGRAGVPRRVGSQARLAVWRPGGLDHVIERFETRWPTVPAPSAALCMDYLGFTPTSAPGVVGNV